MTKPTEPKSKMPETYDTVAPPEFTYAELKDLLGWVMRTTTDLMHQMEQAKRLESSCANSSMVLTGLNCLLMQFTAGLAFASAQ
jgi:hypothetical protein